MSTKQAEQQISARELAEKVGADPTDLRKWLRTEGLATVGEGRRYVFSRDEATKLARKFKAAQKADADAS